MSKPDAKTLKEELRALRKAQMKPVSRMRVADISAEIERLKVGREETPPGASISSAPTKVSKSAVESIKAAKASEFPIEPSAAAPKSKKMPAKEKVPVAKAKPAPLGASKKKSKMDRLLEMMSDTDDE